MNPFAIAPEFVERDNRRFRTYSPVSTEQMHHKHAALLPAHIVANKRVLDLGCGLGATGHWCLSNGARSYTGVEVQHEYAATAAELLERYHPGTSRVIETSLHSFLSDNSEAYDIVTILGVLHASVDIYGHLEAICRRAREVVAIEELMPRVVLHDAEFSGIEYSGRERTNIAVENASLEGRGARISPNGLAFILKDFGFEPDGGVLKPEAITDTVDNFNTPKTPGNARYLVRFVRTTTPSQSVSDDLASGRLENKRTWGI